MIRPSAPIKPKKPELRTPTKSVVESFYLYNVTRWKDDSNSTTAYEFVKDNLSYDEYGDDGTYGEYDKAENIKLSTLLKLLEDKNIDIKDVEIDNEIYYRKSNGQLVLHISKQLNDEEYETWINDNAAQLEKYERDKEQHPALFAEFKKQKKLWDIHQAELKLQELKNDE